MEESNMFDLIPFGRNERNLFQYLDNIEKNLLDGLDSRGSRFRTDILDNILHFPDVNIP